MLENASGLAEEYVAIILRSVTPKGPSSCPWMVFSAILVVLLSFDEMVYVGGMLPTFSTASGGTHSVVWSDTASFFFHRTRLEKRLQLQISSCTFEH